MTAIPPFGHGLQDGIPLLLPPDSTSPEETTEILGLVDGFVLTGGGDVDPDLYAGERHPKIYNTDPQRDECELVWLRAILEARSWAHRIRQWVWHPVPGNLRRMWKCVS